MPRLSLLALLVLFCSTTAVAQSAGTVGVSSVSPTFGKAGTIVTIRGTGLAETGVSWAKTGAAEPPPGAVSFNGVPGDILYWSADLISVKVPVAASSGPLRLMLEYERVILDVGDFEMPYAPTSEPGLKARPMIVEAPAQDVPEQNRDVTRENPGWAMPPDCYAVNPWFSGLAPGERTFFAEHPVDAFWFGNPFELGRRDAFVSGGFRGGFRGRTGFGFNRGFDSFGFGSFGRSHFFNLHNTRTRNFHRPFWFFWR
jgi:hypothetical protein